ncbi:MAG TPA: HD domain-containing phosphohydrolase [Fimbriimonadaceae bacterium]|nr:HD domain-containing phosphohydrolase [Fimbriimonadaceae bacterium]
MLYASIFIAMLVMRPGSKTFYQGFQNSYQIIAPLWASICCFAYWAKGRHEMRSQRAAWFLIGLGCLSFTAGQTTWTVIESVMGQEVPFPGWADVGYLGSYPCLLLGVCMLLYSQHIASRARLFLDSAITVASLAILVWYFLVHKMWIAAEDDTLLNKVISASYPIGDFLAIFIATVALKGFSRQSSLRRSIGFIALGLGMISLADGNFQFMNLVGSYETGAWADWGWSFGFATIGYSAITALWWPKKAMAIDARQATKRMRNAGSMMRVIAPYILVVAALGIVILDDFVKDRQISSSVYTEAIVVFFLILMRQMLMLAENVSLSRQMASMNENLESLVEQRTGQLAAVQRLTRAINNTLNFNEVLSESVRHTRIALGASGVGVWLLKDNGPGLPMSSYLRILDGFEGNSGLESSLNEMALKSSTESVLVRTEDGDVWNCLRAPLKWQNKLIGMIGVLRQNSTFAHSDEELLESIGMEIGTALDHARQHADALAAADHDSVTNLLNHRAVHQRLDRMFSETRDGGGTLAIMMVDLNNFKLFNDTYGHVTGDQVLKKVAKVLNEECSSEMLTARYGGDEFMVVLPDASAERAHILATKIRSRLHEEGFNRPSEERTVPISLSFGIACYPNDGRSRHELLTIADSNLYQAKNSDEGIVFTSESQRANRELRAEASFEVLDALITAVDNKDRYTRKHSEDVTEYALWMAEELGLSEETMRTLRIGGLLHDVGKIGVPDEILRKPGRLSPEEFEVMKRHPRLGELIVGGIPGMESILDAVRSHHERWDGLGYPDQLEGEQIPFMGRLLAVADAFSAMTTDRPYRKGMEFEVALEEIRSNIGTQFDPQMAQAFIQGCEKRGIVLQTRTTMPKAA